MIADDAYTMRALVARAVVAAGHEVVGEAADHTSALDAARRFLPDAIVLDGRLPPGGALATLPHLLAIACEPAIFVVASLDERDLVSRALAAGARGALLRPLRARAIAEALAGRPHA